ncbi:MAG: GNAT family N-acetyltransferase [candidate division Zixibacteria bacterium]|nr:GNAT family N-acetyltransferase [candidate division Zixibacteria bacterium]
MPEKEDIDFDVVKTSSVDRERLVAFFYEVFPKAKASFFEDYGSWLYREDARADWAENYCATRNGEIVGFGATIPTIVSYRGERHEAVWYVDLVVVPEVRRKGVASAIDRAIMALRCWKLGFPNTIALRAHLKTGWSCRRDAAAYLFPWRLWETKKVRKMKRALRLLSFPLTFGLGQVLRQHFKLRIRRGTARAKADVSAGELAEIFARNENPPLTTFRDENYIRWRFFESPWAEDLRYYLAGDPSRICAVVRVTDDGLAARIIDVFGDLSSGTELGDLLRTVCFDLGREGVAQITCLASYPPLQRLLRKTGFLFKIAVPIVLHAESPQLSDALAEAPGHFVYADADKDIIFG